MMDYTTQAASKSRGRENDKNLFLFFEIHIKIKSREHTVKDKSHCTNLFTSYSSIPVHKMVFSLAALFKLFVFVHL